MTDSSEPFTKASVLRIINKKCFSHVASPGTLSNDDGDIYENGEKAIGLDWQNNNFARGARVAQC